MTTADRAVGQKSMLAQAEQTYPIMNHTASSSTRAAEGSVHFQITPLQQARPEITNGPI